MIAIVRVRGLVKVKSEIEDTLKMLHLENKNYVTFVQETPQIRGMIKKAKDFITYGAVDDAFVKDVLSKKGTEYKGRVEDSKGKISYARRFMEIDGKKYKKYVRLAPPLKGYGREGIKKPFSRGGALGNRKDKITELIGRMIR